MKSENYKDIKNIDYKFNVLVENYESVEREQTMLECLNIDIENNENAFYMWLTDEQEDDHIKVSEESLNELRQMASMYDASGK